MATTTVSGRTVATVLDAIGRICSEALGGDEHVFAAGVTQEVADADPMVVPLADDFIETGMPACTLALGEWSPVLQPHQERLTLEVLGAIWRNRVPLDDNTVGLYDDCDTLRDAFIAHAYAFNHHEQIQSVVLMGGQIRLSTGRVVELNFPADLTDTELLDLVGEVAKNVRGRIREEHARPPTGRILVPAR